MLNGSEEPTSGGSGARTLGGSGGSGGWPGSGRNRVGPQGSRSQDGEL